MMQRVIGPNHDGIRRCYPVNKSDTDLVKVRTYLAEQYLSSPESVLVAGYLFSPAPIA